MITLSVDTTCNLCSVALIRDGKAVCEKTIDSGKSHSVMLLPAIAEIFELEGIGAKDVELYAASVGPGSFTGVRIGASTVKGLAFPFNTPCVGVSSLQAMAENLSCIDGIIIPVINARRSQVYTAFFECSNGIVTRLTDDTVITVSELEEAIRNYDNIFFTGDAYNMVSHLTVSETPEKLRANSAVGVGILAERIYLESECKEAFNNANLLPVYLKKTQAEREREEKLELENK